MRWNQAWRRAAPLALIGAVASGCEPTGGAPSSGAPSSSATPSPSATARSSSLVTSSPSSHATATSSSTAPAELVGVWRGPYESKKIKVTLDVGVMEPSFVADNGKTAAGKGTVELTVGADGGVRGTMKGALGDAIVTGAASERSIDAAFIGASDASPSMSGVLSLTLDGGTLRGDLRASSGDATLARGGPVELKRE